MLNARIDIETKESPYKVNRSMPTMLQPYFTPMGEEDYQELCDKLDQLLEPFEEIKAVWMILGIVFTILFLGIIVGIILRFVLVDDADLGLILAASLFGAAFFIFTAYFFLMHLFVVKPLDLLALEINVFCEETARKWEGVELRFERSKSCSVFWDADFQAWINVTSTDAVDLNA
jgi:hypothetical protein